MLQIINKYYSYRLLLLSVENLFFVFRVKDYLWIDDVPTIFDSPLPVILIFLDTLDI